MKNICHVFLVFLHKVIIKSHENEQRFQRFYAIVYVCMNYVIYMKLYEPLILVLGNNA